MPPLTDTELDTALDVALEAADRAMTIARTTPVGSVETKKHAADHVTEVDRATERMVRALVEERLPGHTVVGEEYGGTAGDGPTWFCDPVDGTTNLSAGLPWTSFSLALAVGSDPLVAVVADPWRGEVMQAVAGRGCRIGDRLSTARRRRHADRRRRADRVGRLPTVARVAGTARPAVRAAVHDQAHGVVDAHPRASCRRPDPRRGGRRVPSRGPPRGRPAVQRGRSRGPRRGGNDNRFPSAGGMLVARRGVAQELFGLWREAID